MNRLQRAAYIDPTLESLYPTPAIPLTHGTPFQLLVAVVLSAQCTDKMVNRITPALFAAAPNAATMAKLAESQILRIIRPLGLAPRKAKALRSLSQVIESEHGGVVPTSFEALERLDGVGHKTASVVMAQAFGVPAFAIDTHIHRLAQRWGLTNGKSVVQTELDLKRLFPQPRWNALHLQIIYYGREHCTARGCDGTKCSICKTLYPRRRKPFVHR
jgi:endonuclease III